MQINFYPNEDTELYLMIYPFDSLALGTMKTTPSKGHVFPIHHFHPIFHPRLNINSWDELKKTIENVPGSIAEQADRENEFLKEFFLKTADTLLSTQDKEKTESLEIEAQLELKKAGDELKDYFSIMLRHDIGLVKQLIAENKEVLGVNFNNSKEQDEV